MDAGDETLRDSEDMATGPLSGDAGALANLIVRSATDFAIITSDADGVITSWSPGAEKTMGWSAVEAVGQRVDLFFTPEDVAARRPREEMDCARDQGSASDERWHMKADGTRFWANGEMQPLRQNAGDEDGEIVGYLKILRDRTEHHEMEQKLRSAQADATAASERLLAEEQRLREMFQQAPGFIAVFRGAVLRFELVNASYLKLIGHRDVVGKTIREALPEVEGQGYFEKLDGVFATGVALTEYNMPVMLQQAQEAEPELRYVDYVFQPMHDADGTVAGLFLEGFDVTDAVEARLKAEKLAVEQTAILGQLAEGVIATDADGRIKFVNAAAERLHGVARLDVEPDAYSDTYQLLTEDGAPYPSAELPLARAVLRGETITEARWRIRRPDGTEVVAIGNAQPVIADGRKIGAVLTVRDDTARREAEGALAASEARTRNVLEGMDEGFVTVDGTLRVLQINAEGLRIDGRSREEIVGRGLLEVWPETEHLPNYALFNEVLRTGKPGTIEYSHHSDVHDVWLETRAYPIDGGLAIFYRDVTDRRNATDAVQASEVRFQAITDSIDQMIWSTLPDGSHDYFNRRWYEYTGVPEGSTDGEEWLGLFHPDDQARTEAVWAHSLHTGELYNIEYRLRHRSGEYRWVVGRAQAIRDEAGAITRWYGTCTDIHDAKMAQAALDESRSELRLLLDSTQEAFYSVDTDGVTQVCNKAFVKMLGFEREEDAIGRTLHGLIHHHHPDGSDYPAGDCPIYQCSKTGAPAHVTDEVFFRLDGTPFPVDYRVAPIFREGTLAGAICTFADVSEQRQTERALRETEERYRYAVRATTDAVWDWDFLTDGILWNDALQTAFGHVPDAVASSGEWWIGHIHADDRARVAAGIHAVIDGTGTHWTDEYRFVRADGGYADVLDRGAVIRDADGRAVRMIGAMLDLTDRKAAEAAVRVSEEQYRTLFEAIDAGFCILEMKFGEDGRAVDYRFAEVNPAFERQTGLADAAGKWISELAPDIEQHWKDAYGDVARTRRPARFEDNSPALGRWFEVYAFPVDAPEAMRVAVLFTDVSERKRAEVALTELNRTLETRVAATVAERDMIWRTSQDLFMVNGMDGTHRSVNPAWTEVLGYDAAELIGEQAGTFIHPEDVEEARVVLARLAQGHVVNGLDLRMLHKLGGTRWISWTCVPQGDVFYASGRDVTARKELEEQLRQSQKMEAVGQLTGGIAHDFNNLLTIVSGNIDMARRSLGPDGDARALRSLGNAAKGADRAAALTQRLLAFSRRQPLQPRATDVNKLITGMTELLDRALGETVDLQVVAGAGLWRVEVDPNQLENAVLNLAVNARDAMAGDTKPGGGKLTVETTNAHIDEAYAAAQREVTPGQYVLISVTDTGEGMPPDIVAKAFDPFFSTKDVGKGTGLGLSQVYGYVKQSGGHVKIYSETGEGTTVKLYLPRLIADMNAADEEEVVPEEPTQGRESILVVEDDDDVRIYTVDSLRELGYRVLEAHDGASALRLLERQDEAPRLLLTDVVMPGMSGRELADQARVLYPDMQILYTTGYARNAIVHGGRLDPGVELLPKPFTFEALAGKIREVIEKAVVERALVIDPSDDTREAFAVALSELGFAAEQAVTVREALGKLRATGGSFNVVVLSQDVPVGNFDAVLSELRAVRNDLPVLIVGGALTLEKTDPCVEILSDPVTTATLRSALDTLRVRCSGK